MGLSERDSSAVTNGCTVGNDKMRPTPTISVKCACVSRFGAQNSYRSNWNLFMALRLGDIAPDFSASTTEGPIEFHKWLGNSWGVLFSHPADYTPVCTTELGAVAKIKAEFEK